MLNEKETKINGFECVNTSFPEFLDFPEESFDPEGTEMFLVDCRKSGREYVAIRTYIAPSKEWVTEEGEIILGWEPLPYPYRKD